MNQNKRRAVFLLVTLGSILLLAAVWNQPDQP